jgi:antitoxin (DNA-binding transcriptional repressor) of toxin-antitoxin stability system
VEATMTAHVSKSKFKAKALEYFRQVEASGEPIVITEHGKPKLEIRRLPEQTVDPLEKLKGSVLWYDRPFDPAVDEDDWEVLR